MDSGTGQNRPLVLSIFVLALLLTIQAQIKERGVKWQGQLLLKS